MKFGLASCAEDEQGDAGTVSAVEGRVITRLDLIKVLKVNAVLVSRWQEV
jgi:hypothetical protein